MNGTVLPQLLPRNMAQLRKKGLYSNCNFSLRLFSSSPKKVQHVCIVGAGPAGFYAAMHLTKKLSDVKVDIIEKLPVPFGLIRYGVAPDHPEVKNVINQFTKVAQQANVNFYGNIALGKDVKLSELRQHYNSVLLTYGAEQDNLLGIENENVNEVVPARNFVGWYNGHPYAKDFKIDLSGQTAAVLGQGNVALDVARILLTPVDELRKTDIPENVLDVLSQSKLKELYLIGRRGPLQVAFTIKELREQIKLKNCRIEWREADFIGVAETVDKLERPRKRLTELMLKSLKESKEPISEDIRAKVFKPVFYRSPSKFLVDDKRKLIGVELRCNKIVGDSVTEMKCVPTDQTETLNCSLVFRSIGYNSINMDHNLVIDSNGVIVNDRGRVIDANKDLAKLYVAGWLGTGPAGVILHTMGNAFQVAKNMTEDLEKDEGTLPKGGFDMVRSVISKNTQIVDWRGWEKIDQYEVETGSKLGKPREKICCLKKLIEVANN